MKKIEKYLKEIETNFNNVSQILGQQAREKIRASVYEERVPNREVKKLSALKKIEIPIFNGRSYEYESWKAGFMPCANEAEGSIAEKLLHLRQYLQREPKRMIRNLGYSDEAYDLALKRLETRYGGEERNYWNLRQIREGDFKDFENFAEWLYTLILRFEEMRRGSELGNSIFIKRIMQKLQEKLLERWIKKIAKNKYLENVKDCSEGASLIPYNI